MRAEEALCTLQMARKRTEAPRFIAGSLKDDAMLGKLPYAEHRGLRGEVLPAKGPARAPWPTLPLQVSHTSHASNCAICLVWLSGPQHVQADCRKQPAGLFRACQRGRLWQIIPLLCTAKLWMQCSPLREEAVSTSCPCSLQLREELQL